MVTSLSLNSSHSVRMTTAWAPAQAAIADDSTLKFFSRHLWRWVLFSAPSRRSVAEILWAGLCRRDFRVGSLSPIGKTKREKKTSTATRIGSIAWGDVRGLQRATKRAGNGNCAIRANQKIGCKLPLKYLSSALLPSIDRITKPPPLLKKPLIGPSFFFDSKHNLR